MIQTTAKVVDIERSVSGDVAFVYFKPAEIFTLQEGQFMFLERIGFAYPDGKAMKNAYSIGTTNKQMQDKHIIGTIVKKSSEGGMSEYLTQTIAIGDEIKLTGPLGHFVDPGLSKKYLFMSIGSGITPVFAQYVHLVHEAEDYDKVVNIFGERYEKHILSSVSDVYTRNDDTVKNMIYLSQGEDLPANRRRGYIQQGLEEAIEFLGESDFVAFLCGKPAMVDDVRNILIDRGLPTENIKFEKY